MMEINTKSFLLRTAFGIALGWAALAGAACGDGGDEVAPGGDTDDVCGGFAGTLCPPGKFCDYQAGSCGHGDALGTCQAIPTACTLECTNACGCDGQSYCNACVAHTAGVDDSAETTCEGAPPTAN
ncbi:MAG TPA: hypothetical protein VK540_25655 [Polyangiaceae bacterium]|nr:hypothetical protein [Polyangiaceae bacterium]